MLSYLGRTKHKDGGGHSEKGRSLGVRKRFQYSEAQCGLLQRRAWLCSWGIVEWLFVVVLYCWLILCQLVVRWFVILLLV